MACPRLYVLICCALAPSLLRPQLLKPFSAKLVDRSKPYIPAPIAAFELTAAGVLIPSAIVLDVAVAGTPRAIARDAANSPKWRFAKMCVRVADWGVHELGSHLTLTHLVSEVIALATYRSLPKAHPVYQLLAPHFHKVRGCQRMGGEGDVRVRRACRRVRDR